MRFTKMQGAGNDYVYINCFEETVEDPAGLARRISDRHFGVGSDGLVLICPSQTADCRMRMFNADGSEGEMCGNAIRCVGKFVYEHGLLKSTRQAEKKEARESFELTVETLGGIKNLKLWVEDGRVPWATVDMGEPRLTSLLPEAIIIDGEAMEFVGISVGNPHAVYFRDDIDSLDLNRIGPVYETHPRFPDRVNSEFVQVVDRGHVRMRVWERGSGETLACGTGATACAVACVLMGYTEASVEVELRGGSLMIWWDRGTNRVYMKGPAEEVFHGEFQEGEKKHVSC